MKCAYCGGNHSHTMYCEVPIREEFDRKTDAEIRDLKTRLSAAESERDEYKKIASYKSPGTASLKGKLIEATRVIEYYGDRSNWTGRLLADFSFNGTEDSDGGDKARTYLAQYSERQEGRDG